MNTGSTRQIPDALFPVMTDSVQNGFTVLMFPDYRKNNPYQAELAKHLEENSVRVLFPPGYRRGLHFTRTTCQIGFRDARVLHLHWPDMYLRGSAKPVRRIYAAKLLTDLRLAKRGKRKLAWTVHNLGSHDSGGRDTVEAAFNRSLARLADCLLVHDENLVPEAAATFRISPKKVHVAPHGHYADVYGGPPSRLVCRERLGIAPESPLVLFFGMLRPYKGLDDLLDIWGSVRERVDGATLLIAGGGRDEAYRAHVKERCTSLPGVVLHNRFIPDEDIPLYFGAADVAAFPFRRITTSGSLILALSYSCPVVAPRIPSVTGQLDFQKELLYDPEHLGELKDCLVRGIQLDASSLDKNFKAVRSHYSWRRAADLTEKAYRSTF